MIPVNSWHDFEGALMSMSRKRLMATRRRAQLEPKYVSLRRNSVSINEMRIFHQLLS